MYVAPCPSDVSCTDWRLSYSFILGLGTNVGVLNLGSFPDHPPDDQQTQAALPRRPRDDNVFHVLRDLLKRRSSAVDDLDLDTVLILLSNTSAFHGFYPQLYHKQLYRSRCWDLRFLFSSWRRESSQERRPSSQQTGGSSPFSAWCRLSAHRSPYRKTLIGSGGMRK